MDFGDDAAIGGGQPIYPLPIEPDLARKPEDLLPDLSTFTLDDRAADEAEKVIGLLKVTEGRHAGKPFSAVLMPWQRTIVRALHGLRLDDGSRQVQNITILASRKSGKSSFSAMLALTEMVLSTEERGQFLILSGSVQQSKIAFAAAANAIRADDFLQTKFVIRDYNSEIYFHPTNSTLKVIAGSAASIYGLGANFAIIDEVHVLGQLRKGQGLVSAVQTGQIARSNPCIVFISTAPDGFESGVFSQVYNRARAIVRGQLKDDRTLTYLGELPETTLLDDPSTWVVPNPSVPVTVSLQRLKDEQKKLGDDVTMLASWRSQHLNIVPATSTGGAGFAVWVRRSRWEQCTDDEFSPAPWEFDDILAGADETVMGLDAGGQIDLTALVLLARHGDIWRMVCRQYFSQRSYEDQKHIGPDTRQHIMQGYLRLYEPGEDVAEISEIIKKVHQTKTLLGIGSDAYAAGIGLHKALLDASLPLIATPRGYRAQPAIGQLEDLIINDKLRHDGDPQMTHQIGNIVVKETASGRALTKSSTMAFSRIDGVMALLSAAAIMCDRDLQAAAPIDPAAVVF